MSNQRYDVIIVGAGSAGSVLAEQLSGDPGCQVLLLEAGGSNNDPWVHVPKGLAFVVSNPKHAWHYPTEPFGPNEQVEYWARGKGLGGSSAINGMMYNRGSRPDFDALEQAGNSGWGWDEILRIYRAMEDHALGASDARGTGGRLKVGVQRTRERVDDLLQESGTHIGLRAVDDINASDDERIGLAPATIRKGLRQSAAKAFLGPAMKRPNLTVRTGTTVERILFEGDAAVGVAGRSQSGPVEFRAHSEVVLCLGAIATPALLERSGIGQAEVLADAGVDLRVDSPRIGEGVREHRCVPMQVRLNKDIGYNRRLRTRVAQGVAGVQWAIARTGPIATPAYDMFAFLKTASDLDRPDAQLLLTPYSAGVGGAGAGVEHRPGFSLMGFASRPTSEGSIHIRSAEAAAPPRIVPNYLATEHDRRVTVGVFRKMRELAQASPIAELSAGETVPGPVIDDADDDAILRYALIGGGTGYHACGAVQMGAEDDAPVDPRLRVRGINGLRIADVSVFPSMVSGNLNAPAMALGYRAAELIREEM